ncbi:cytochrome b5-like heme/steroid binding domain-containing protein [Methanosarcina barkeri]|uniref:cytochrome b5 domain-containing protein n=1 Tax=Methanosarcina barkeri TaxID=2208 RepID=UPI001FB1C600|nr:cytochrome b5 domain-containing protein [Methanosarcina barkeri]
MTRKSELKEYTLKELTEYNGENGTAYVAYQSQVYNVSDSDIWKNGTHKGCNAGTDLTGKMDKTPHGAAILKGYPVVGTLKKITLESELNQDSIKLTVKLVSSNHQGFNDPE